MYASSPSFFLLTNLFPDCTTNVPRATIKSAFSIQSEYTITNFKVMFSIESIFFCNFTQPWYFEGNYELLPIAHQQLYLTCNIVCFRMYQLPVYQLELSIYIIKPLILTLEFILRPMVMELFFIHQKLRILSKMQPLRPKMKVPKNSNFSWIWQINVLEMLYQTCF